MPVLCSVPQLCGNFVFSGKALDVRTDIPQWYSNNFLKRTLKITEKSWLICTCPPEHFVLNKHQKGCSVAWLVLVTHLWTYAIVYKCAVLYTCAGTQARQNDRAPPPHIHWSMRNPLSSPKCTAFGSPGDLSPDSKLCWGLGRWTWEATGEAQQQLKCLKLRSSCYSRWCSLGSWSCYR